MRLRRRFIAVDSTLAFVSVVRAYGLGFVMLLRKFFIHISAGSKLHGFKLNFREISLSLVALDGFHRS